MKTFIIHFLASLGVIFLILIAVAIYLFIADPFNIKPLFSGGGLSGGSAVSEQGGSSTSTPEGNFEGKHPFLNASQEAALESFGIDPATLPREITAEQEACFVEALGQARVDEIKGGATPTASEFFRARGCF